MKLYEIQNILDATILTGRDPLDRTIVGGGGADLMADVLSVAAKDIENSQSSHAGVQHE